MANEELLAKLKQGADKWNNFRQKNPNLRPWLSDANLKKWNLRGANLSNAMLARADFEGSDLRSAEFINAILYEANSSGADLNSANFLQAELIKSVFYGSDCRNANFNSANLNRATIGESNLCGATFSEANLSWADLRDLDLSGANLNGTNLRGANLNGTNLTGANLEGAILVETNLTGANLSGCKVYGISVWRTELEGATQTNLIITPSFEPMITVDSLEVAQFIYLLLNNEKIRHVIDTITSKVVLILGRFTVGRKNVLDAIRNELRNRDYLPVVFDFDKPASRDLTETISTLAHMARFIIADITDAKSIPQELQAIVPNLPSVPIQPLLLGSATEYGMFEHFKRFPWVLEICRYHDPDELIQSIHTKVIAPAEERANALMEAENK